ncbi:hypothetical protein [Peribacillus glennii]|uniref:Uncharacterized protein n=1 Tax=Peribacillus glennii TaxID=2303991 RepID=A0A372L8F1_9BACI|nr:hypothetical protein [Peribacillus glennii]RFU61135.1 hypothetical protein D0466_19330 [Peribacillus glennii]
MKEFRVCYTYDSEIRFVEIRKKTDTNPEDVRQEILHSLLQLSDIETWNTEKKNGTSFLRYVRVIEGERG